MRVSPRTFPGVLHPQNYTAVDWFVKDLVLWFHLSTFAYMNLYIVYYAEKGGP